MGFFSIPLNSFMIFSSEVKCSLWNLNSKFHVFWWSFSIFLKCECDGDSLWKPTVLLEIFNEWSLSLFLSAERLSLFEQDCVKSFQIRSVFWFVFSPNAGKYGPEKTLYLDTFHAVQFLIINFCTSSHIHDREFLIPVTFLSLSFARYLVLLLLFLLSFYKCMVTAVLS